MRHTPFLRAVLMGMIGLLASLSPMAFAQPLTPYEQTQVFAFRATSSLLLLRGEGLQDGHRKRLEGDMVDLDKAFTSIASPSAELRTTYQALVTQLRNGATYGPKEEDMPFRFPQDLSKSLRDFMLVAYSEGAPSAKDELPAKIEYLAVQYLYRAYMGSFETAREHPDQYLGQDERVLLPSIDKQLTDLNAKSNPEIAKLKPRWEYLKSALGDMNSQSNTLASASGRAFAPITVDRHTRAFSTQWMALK
ncbi:MAG: hypothetical protein V4812_00970 [Pseudomonadota bacterium]